MSCGDLALRFLHETVASGAWTHSTTFAVAVLSAIQRQGTKRPVEAPQSKALIPLINELIYVTKNQKRVA